MGAGFLEMRFPTGIAYGAAGGPSYSTTIVQFQNGRETRNQQWAQGLGMWDVSYGVKTQAEVDQLVAFFRTVKGRAFGFRFKDWSDFSVTKGYIGTGDGATFKFQISKQYLTYDLNGSVCGGEVRTVYKPVPGTVTVYVGTIGSSVPDGYALVENVNYTIDYTTGVITFLKHLTDYDYTPATGKGIWATFQFDIPVRFDTDQMKVTLEDWNAYSWGQVMVREIIPY